MNEHLKALASMIERSEKAQQKFAEGSSQHTLQKNRIRALYIASALIVEETTQNNSSQNFTKEELEKALAPLTSLISKSEKARTKLKTDSWQYRMLNENLNALHTALPLLEREIRVKKIRGTA